VLRGRTLLVVSHRQLVLETCDRVLVLVDGRLNLSAGPAPTLAVAAG